MFMKNLNAVKLLLEFIRGGFEFVLPNWVDLLVRKEMMKKHVSGLVNYALIFEAWKSVESYRIY